MAEAARPQRPRGAAFKGVRSRSSLKLARKPRAALLRAVDKYKPYMQPTQRAQDAAWKLVQRDMGADKKIKVAERFTSMVAMVHDGTYPSAQMNPFDYQLLTKLVEDMDRCERLGYPTGLLLAAEAPRHGEDDGHSESLDNEEEINDARDDPGQIEEARGEARQPDKPQSNEAEQNGRDDRQVDEGATDGNQDEERTRGTAAPRGEPAYCLRPKRRRDAVDDAEPSPQRACQSPIPPKKRRTVDETSDEQFVDLLAEHAPHLATTDRGTTTAWQRVGDGLPVGNTLWGRTTQGLKRRLAYLQRHLTSTSTAERNKLTPHAKAALKRYLTRIEAHPRGLKEAAPAVAEPVPDARGLDEAAPAVAEEIPDARPPPVVCAAKQAATTMREAAAIAFATEVQKAVHREVMQSTDAMLEIQREAARHHANLHRTILARLDHVSLLLKKFVQEGTHKTPALAPGAPPG